MPSYSHGAKGNKWHNNRPQPYKGKGSQGGGKGKRRGSKGLLPKFLIGRDNTNMDMHGRRLCFNYQVGRGSEGCRWGRMFPWLASLLQESSAPHAEKDHDGKKK